MTNLARVHFQPQPFHLVYSSSGPILISIALFCSASFTAFLFASPLDLHNPLTCFGDQELSKLVSDSQSLYSSKGNVMEPVSSKADSPDFVHKDYASGLNYWLYGTATEINWFDKGCMIGWDYIKGCFTSSCVGYPESAAKLVVDDASFMLPDEGLVGHTPHHKPMMKGACEASKPCYILMALGCLALGYAVAGNLDVFKAGIAFIDSYFYEFLCMFDFPGFLVDRRAVMPLLPGLDLHVMNKWSFIHDPADGIRRLTHLASYTLNLDGYGFFVFNALSPGWSIPSYATMTIVPGLYWPLNYDHYHYIQLFQIG